LAIQISDSAAICKTLIQMGAAKITKGDINQSIEHFIEAEKIAAKIDNRILLVDAINYLGISYYLIDNLDEALIFSDKALKLSNKLNYEEGKALAYEHFVIVYVKQEKFAEAIELNS
ncbi:MAG TPA: tetratricopeptide repeat protein, partial [Ignavibacteriaceae bacterium]|nr:tetratricopeptide repeat protein [Ignavibacteriaceae bacterium]